MIKRLLSALGLYLACLLPVQAGVPCSVPFTLSNGTLADANQVMANYNAIIACLGNAAAAGSNSDITALNSLTAPITPTQGGTNVFIGGTSTGSANAQAIGTTIPNIFTLTEGYAIIFIPGFTNTGPMTFKVGSTAAVNVARTTTVGPLTALLGGEVVSGQITAMVYDGTEFVLSNVPTPTGGFGSITNLAISSGVLDLGTGTTHSVFVTNGGTISSFGTTASPFFPRYFVRFGAAATLVNSSTLVLPGSTNVAVNIGDGLEAFYAGSGVWLIIDFTHFSGMGSTLTPAPLCGANSLAMGVASGTSLTYSALSSVMVNSVQAAVSSTAVNGAINTTIGTGTSTPDGMDGEARPVNGFGYVYFISNNTSTNGLISTNSTVPNLPAGYTFYCRVGAVNFDGSSNMYGTTQFGRKVTYNTPPFLISGPSGDPTTGAWTAIGVAQFVPPTVASTELTLTLSGISAVCPQGGPCGPAAAAAIAPSTSYGAIGTDTGASTNPPPVALTAGYTINSAGITSQHTYGQSAMGSFLGSGPFAYAANAPVGATTGVHVYGWTDRVNAN